MVDRALSLVQKGRYMVVGTLSLMHKGQTSGCRGIVVYGGGDIVFGAKRSNQWVHWMWWTQWNSSMWWWGHCLWCKKVKTVDTVNAVE